MTTNQPPKTSVSRILVVEDHPFLRQGLVQWINHQSGLICCGDADSCAAARKAVTDLRPDLVIMDLGLNGEDGLDLIKQLTAESPSSRILVLSQADETVFAERVLRAGGMGYLMKQEPTEEVLRAIRCILGGDIHLSRRMATRLLRSSLGPHQGLGATASLGHLSDRELQVFQLIGSGLPNASIAAKMGISVKTVETHRENIKHKLGLADAAALTAAATNWIRRPAGQL